MDKIRDFFANLNFKLENGFDSIGKGMDKKSSAILVAIIGTIAFVAIGLFVWFVVLR